MASIVTITFNPCIDKSTVVPQLIPEKKLQCSSPKLEPGGGGINVARAIKKLGGEAIAIFPTGGYTGKFIQQLMYAENVTTKTIETKNETRENIIVLEEATNNQYRFGMPGAELSENEYHQCLKAIEEINEASYIVASGSLPHGIPLDIYAQIAKIAKTKNAKFIVDTSGESLKHAIKEGVYLLKPNLGELAYLSGQKNLQPSQAEGVAKTIIQNNKCEIIVVSMGAEGALLVTKDITELIAPPPVIRKSTVGAGDSMVAGIVFYLSLGKTISEAVRYGVACGTAATLNPGTELCSREDVEGLYGGMDGG